MSVNELNTYIHMFILKQPKIRFNINITRKLVFVHQLFSRSLDKQVKILPLIFWNTILKSRAQNKNIRE